MTKIINLKPFLFNGFCAFCIPCFQRDISASYKSTKDTTK